MYFHGALNCLIIKIVYLRCLHHGYLVQKAKRRGTNFSSTLILLDILYVYDTIFFFAEIVLKKVVYVDKKVNSVGTFRREFPKLLVVISKVKKKY